MKKLAVVLFIVVFATAASAQDQHTVQIDDGAGHLSVLHGQTVDALDAFSLPVGGGTILAQLAGQPTVSKAWLLGGNTSSSPNNSIGTLDPSDLNIVTSGSTRLSVLSGGDVWIGGSSKFVVSGSSGNISTINGLTGYSWPTSHSAGELVNDGTGVLTWGTASVQTSKAGLGSYITGNIQTNHALGPMKVAGASSITSLVPAFNGVLSGLSLSLQSASGGGGLVATVYINGTATSLTLSVADGDQFVFATPGSTINFSAGDHIEVRYSSTGYSNGSDEMIAIVFAQF